MPRILDAIANTSFDTTSVYYLRVFLTSHAASCVYLRKSGEISIFHIYSLYWGNTTARIALLPRICLGFRMDNSTVLYTALLMYLH